MATMFVPVFLSLTPILVLGAPGGARQAHSFKGGFDHRPSSYNYKTTCGRSGVRSSDKKWFFKILNGTCAPYGAHPWMVQIQTRNHAQHNRASDFQHHCGGAILTDDIIMTAAHCVVYFEPYELRVIVGQGSLSADDSEEMAFDVESTTVHPNWDYGVRYSNDIALVKLRRKGNGQGIDFSEKVGPVCLPSYDSPQKPGTECVVSGWGKTDVGATKDTDCLKSVTVPLIGQQQCRQMYQDADRDLSDSMLCAGYTHGGADSCNADSGGPLTCKTEGKSYLHGIVSWGSSEGCGLPNRPGVYTNVKHYLKWIEETMITL